MATHLWSIRTWSLGSTNLIWSRALVHKQLHKVSAWNKCEHLCEICDLFWMWLFYFLYLFLLCLFFFWCVLFCCLFRLLILRVCVLACIVVLVCIFSIFLCVHMRSGRERGVHELAMKSGVGFPCPISWVTLPMKKSCDDEEIELVQWPILCPSDFVS